MTLYQYSNDRITKNLSQILLVSDFIAFLSTIIDIQFKINGVKRSR